METACTFRFPLISWPRLWYKQSGGEKRLSKNPELFLCSCFCVLICPQQQNNCQLHLARFSPIPFTKFREERLFPFALQMTWWQTNGWTSRLQWLTSCPPVLLTSSPAPSILPAWTTPARGRAAPLTTSKDTRKDTKKEQYEDKNEKSIERPAGKRWCMKKAINLMLSGLINLTADCAVPLGSSLTVQGLTCYLMSTFVLRDRLLSCT